MRLNEAYQLWLPQIEADLRELLAGADSEELATYYGMLRYHLGWLDEDLWTAEVQVGKRLRPLLCLLASDAVGGDPHIALPAASALELIHNFSLVHDDIQDQSRFRRGRRAVWDLWGAAHGINVGDGLFVLARLALYRLDATLVASHRREAAAQALDKACLALCEGQYLDMSFEDRLDVDLEQYLQMIRRKTAALLALSAQIGAILATDSEDLREHLSAFGESLGLAFQIRDDILGIWGDERVTGKSAASDLRDKKKTLPVVYALNHTEDRDAAREMAALLLGDGPLSALGIQSALAVLDRVGAREFCEELEGDHYRQALRDLEQTGLDTAEQAPLKELAASLLGRAV